MKKAAPPANSVIRVTIFTFVVHVWRERVGSHRFVWRGSLTDVQTGGTKYFQSIAALARLMAKAVKTKPKE
jgi:hypothetical protein